MSLFENSLFPIQNASHDDDIFRGQRTSAVALSVNSVPETATTERSSNIGAKSFCLRIMDNLDVEQMILFNNDNLLNDNDMMLLLLAPRGRRNLHYNQPYWQYEAFNLERMDETSAWSSFG